MLTVGSTFTGVGGADLGLEKAGFRISWMCEADQWKRTVLRSHWENTPIYNDVRTVVNTTDYTGQLFDDGLLGADADLVDVLVGGFPCQDLSVAGKRKGFSGERSVLAFEFLRIAETLKPRWLLMENVPGLLSSNGGRDLARLLDEVGASGYGWAYRIFDARHFGVPQRRRRIFIAARRCDISGDSGSASELALRALWEGSGGDSTPGWPPREITARAATGRARASSEQQVTQDLQDDLPIGFYPTGGSQQGFAKWDGLSPALKAADGPTAIAFRKSRRAASNTDDETWVDDGFANTLNTFDVGDNRTTHAIANGMTVRRLTPVECERLMGWPDGWTAPVGVKAPDSNRYAACGDGIVSWVAYWIGQRIRMIEEES